MVIALVVLATLGFVFRTRMLRYGIAAYQILRGRKTVKERLVEYGAAARARWAPQFEAVQVPYPPERVVLVGLKQEKILEVWAAGEDRRMHLVRKYPVLAASGRLGPKMREGDKQVPEGLYRIESLNPNSMFHLSLRLDYPNEFDRDQARHAKRKKLGCDIMIHGSDVSIGCLAMGDEAAEDLFVLAADTGLENISVILSPVDLRVTALPEELISLPDWTEEIYDMIACELACLPPAPSTPAKSAFWVLPPAQVEGLDREQRDRIDGMLKQAALAALGHDDAKSTKLADCVVMGPAAAYYVWLLEIGKLDDWYTLDLRQVSFETAEIVRAYRLTGSRLASLSPRIGRIMATADTPYDPGQFPEARGYPVTVAIKDGECDRNIGKHDRERIKALDMKLLRTLANRCDSFRVAERRGLGHILQLQDLAPAERLSLPGRPKRGAMMPGQYVVMLNAKREEDGQRVLIQVRTVESSLGWRLPDEEFELGEERKVLRIMRHLEKVTAPFTKWWRTRDENDRTVDPVTGEITLDMDGAPYRELNPR